MHLFFLINFVHSSPHPSEFVASFKMGVLGQNLIDFFGKLQRCVAHHWIRIEQDSPFLVSFVPYACVWALFLVKKNTHTNFTPIPLGVQKKYAWPQSRIDFLMFWGLEAIQGFFDVWRKCLGPPSKTRGCKKYSRK